MVDTFVVVVPMFSIANETFGGTEISSIEAHVMCKLLAIANRIDRKCFQLLNSGISYGHFTGCIFLCDCIHVFGSGYFELGMDCVCRVIREQRSIQCKKCVNMVSYWLNATRWWWSNEAHIRMIAYEEGRGDHTHSTNRTFGY